MFLYVENLYLCSLVSPEQMERTLHTNLIAPLFITKTLTDILAKPGKISIINIIHPYFQFYFLYHHFQVGVFNNDFRNSAYRN